MGRPEGATYKFEFRRVASDGADGRKNFLLALGNQRRWLGAGGHLCVLINVQERPISSIPGCRRYLLNVSGVGTSVALTFMYSVEAIR
mgnify:CR=1 FL=1